MHLAESLLQALKRYGAREIFGIPGDFALPLFDAIERSGILPLYALSHEPAVGFAADAAARFNCGLGVAAVTYGAGALNLVNAVAGAYAERSPVVVVSGALGAAERASGLLLHHQVKSLESQRRIFAEITCDQAVLDDAVRAPAAIARALRNALTRSMPVYLELPRDMAGADCAPVPEAPAPVIDLAAVDACAEEILARLAAARSAVLMVDVEVRRYGLEDKVAALVRRLGLPVVTSFMGRGLLAHGDAPPLGTYLGGAGDPAIAALVEHADALLLLGVIPSDTNLGVSAGRIDPRRSIHAVDRQVRVGFHVYPDVPLNALVDAMLAHAPVGGGRRSARPPAAAPCGLAADAQPITPGDIACAVNEMIAESGPNLVAVDVGDCLFSTLEIGRASIVAPGCYAGMGFAVPAGLGLQATSGQRPVILVGDGGFAMTGWELANCGRYGWDPIVIVFNNRGWGMLRALRPAAGYTDLPDGRFAEAASALGGSGIRVHTRAELKAALARAVAARGRFQLIEAMIDRGVMSPALARFAAQAAAPRPNSSADARGDQPRVAAARARAGLLEEER